MDFSSVLDGQIGIIQLSIMAFRTNCGVVFRLAYITEFIEAAKASGLVQKVIESAGLRGVQLAPPAKRNE